jgi:hypothetical protein
MRCFNCYDLTTQGYITSSDFSPAVHKACAFVRREANNTVNMTQIVVYERMCRMFKFAALTLELVLKQYYTIFGMQTTVSMTLERNAPRVDRHTTELRDLEIVWVVANSR